MWDLSQYTIGNLAFNSFLQNLSKEKTWASRIVLKIFCKFFFVHLVIGDLEKPTIRSIAKGSTRGLLWLKSKEIKILKDL